MPEPGRVLTREQLEDALAAELVSELDFDDVCGAALHYLDRVAELEKERDEWKKAIGDQAESLGLPRNTSVADLMVAYADEVAARRRLNTGTDE